MLTDPVCGSLFISVINSWHSKMCCCCCHNFTHLHMNQVFHKTFSFLFSSPTHDNLFYWPNEKWSNILWSVPPHVLWCGFIQYYRGQINFCGSYKSCSVVKGAPNQNVLTWKKKFNILKVALVLRTGTNVVLRQSELVLTALLYYLQHAEFLDLTLAWPMLTLSQQPVVG